MNLTTHHLSSSNFRSPSNLDFHHYPPLISYQDDLDKSGYKHKLKYRTNIDTASNKKQRKRNIIWFNPPYNKNVKTNIGKIFLNLIKKHFPPHHKFHKLFNKNTVKISYSCTQNIKSIINSRNAKILFPKKSTEQRTCNCLNKVNCPLEQKCLTTNIFYKAKVRSSNQNYQEIVYFGSCETSIENRFSNHKKSFNLKEYKNETVLSNEIWRIKKSCHHSRVKWEIVKKCVRYSPQTKCLNEKLEIVAYKEQNLLKKRNEIVSRCRHQLKYALARFDTKH